MIFFISLLFFSLLAGICFYRSFPLWKTTSRFLAALLPAMLAVIGYLFYHKILWAAYDEHNWVRLKNSFVIALGYPLYYLPDQGPALTTIYGPVAALAYLPATVTKDPLLALSIATTIAMAFFFLPVFWIHTSRSFNAKRFVFSAFTFSLFCFASFLFNSLKESAFNVHADAPALGLGALACSILYHRKNSEKPSLLFLSSLFAVVAVWSKQVMVPLLIALPLYLLLTKGRHIFCRYLVYLALSGFAITGLFASIFDPRAMFYHMVTLPSRHGFRSPFLGESCEGILKIILDLIIVSPLVLLPAYLFFRRRKSRFIPWLRMNPWLLFILVALVMLPMAILSYAKVGGSDNTLSFVTYYLLLGITLSWKHYLRSSLSSTRQIMRVVIASVLIFAGVVFLAIHIPVGFFRIAAFPPGDNFALRAYAYIQKHPGETYFPRLSLLHLLGEGKLYHSLEGLIDRAWGGVALTQEQFLKYTPQNLKLLGFSRENYRHDLPLTGFSLAETNVEELPGFTVYRP